MSDPALASGRFEPTITDLNNNESGDFFTFTIMSDNQRQTGIGLTGNFDNSNLPDCNDIYKGELVSRKFVTTDTGTVPRGDYHAPP